MKAIANFLLQAQRKVRELIYISLILIWIIDLFSDIVRYMPHIQVHHSPLVKQLEQRFNFIAFVGHDIRSLALTEYYCDGTQDCVNSILVRFHRGTLAWILINRQIFLGSNGNIGEMGYIQVDPL